MRRHVHTFDRVIGNVITSLPKWLHLPMVLISFFGQPAVTGGLATLIIGIGYGEGNNSLVIAGFVALVTMIVGSILKLLLRRNRPVTEYVEKMFFHTFSFPSGHAAGSLPAFGLLAYLLLTSVTQPTGTLLAVELTLLIFLIGVSRVYLGAHYASDVIGGWIVGLAGLAVIVFIVQPSL